MTKRVINGLGALVGVLLLVGVLAAPAAACGDEANRVHVGVVTQVDGDALTLTLLDAATGKHLTFAVTAEQAATVQANARVVIHYAEQDGKLVAEEIRA